MFSASADFYDLIYSTFKEYAAEAAKIASLLRRHNPRCQTVLDVACGTGEHARLLAAEGFAVDGLDLDPQASEVHELGLFTTAQLLRAFAEAGLDVEFDPKGLTDRGLYLARIRI